MKPAQPLTRRFRAPIPALAAAVFDGPALTPTDYRLARQRRRIVAYILKKRGGL